MSWWINCFKNRKMPKKGGEEHQQIQASALATWHLQRFGGSTAATPGRTHSTRPSERQNPRGPRCRWPCSCAERQPWVFQRRFSEPMEHGNLSLKLLEVADAENDFNLKLVQSDSTSILNGSTLETSFWGSMKRFSDYGSQVETQKPLGSF